MCPHSTRGDTSPQQLQQVGAEGTIQNNSGPPQKCRTQACASTCAVKGPHPAPLATKGFFGKCQKPEHLKFPVALPVERMRGMDRMLRSFDKPIPLRLARAGRDRLEPQGLVLSVRSLTRLAQDEEPGLCCREARSRGGLGMTGKNAVARTRFTCRAQRGASDVSRRGTSLVRDRS